MESSQRDNAQDASMRFTTGKSSVLASIYGIFIVFYFSISGAEGPAAQWRRRCLSEPVWLGQNIDSGGSNPPWSVLASISIPSNPVALGIKLLAEIRTSPGCQV